MSSTALSTRVLLASGGLPAKQVVAPLPTYAASTPYIVPVISAQNTVLIAAAVIGLAPMFPVIAVPWLPVFVIPVFVRITKLFVVRDMRSGGVGPTPRPSRPVPLPPELLSSPPPHPAATAVMANATHHINALKLLLYFSIRFSLVSRAGWPERPVGEAGIRLVTC